MRDVRRSEVHAVAMPVFHFNIRRGRTVFEDRQGSQMAGLADAVRHATEDARTIMREEPEVPASEQWVEIVDDVGNTLRTVPFVSVH